MTEIDDHLTALLAAAAKLSRAQFRQDVHQVLLEHVIASDDPDVAEAALEEKLRLQAQRLEIAPERLRIITEMLAQQDPPGEDPDILI